MSEHMINKQDVETDENKGIIYAVDAIVRDLYGNVALIQSSKDYFEGKWLLPGGKRKRAEHLRKAVLREVKEELGIDVIIKGCVGQFNRKGRDGRYLPDYEVVSDCFLAEALIGDIRPDRREADDVRWFAPEEIRKMRSNIGLDHYDMMEAADIV